MQLISVPSQQYTQITLSQQYPNQHHTLSQFRNNFNVGTSSNLFFQNNHTLLRSSNSLFANNNNYYASIISSKRIYLNLNIEVDIILSLNGLLNECKISAVFTSNAKPIIVKSKSRKLLLYRFLNKLNSNILSLGTYRLSEAGELQFKYCHILTQKHYDYFRTSKWNTQINQLQLEISNHLSKILYLMGQINEDILKSLVIDNRSNGKIEKAQLKQKEKEIQKQKNQQMITQQNQILGLIIKIQSVDQFQYGFMYNHVLKKINFPNAQCKRRLKKSQQKFNLIQKSIKQLNEHLNLSLFQLNSLKVSFQQFKYGQDWIEQFDRIFIRYLTLPIAKVSNQIDNVYLFTSIYVFNLQQMNKNIIVGESGLNLLYRNRIIFTYITDPRIDVTKKKDQQTLNQIGEAQRLTKLLVIKQQKQNSSQDYNKSKIRHQKQILKQIKDCSCVNIVKCYQNNQNQLRHTLIMDFYAYRSLDCYINLNTTSLSLMTKVYLLCQTIQGLRFLRDNRIVHLDMKPQNILIGKGLLLRLSDFGQSYHPDVCGRDFRSGYTIPYVAPQVFYDNPKYDQKSDVYSLGVLMYELFFIRTPINVKTTGHDKLVEYYQSIQKEMKMNEKIILNAENIDTYGTQKLMKILANMCLKCMKTNQDQRPYLDWILIQLRQCLNYLDKLY